MPTICDCERGHNGLGMTGNLRDAIRAAFDAGCEQGSDEATAHEWGSSPQQSRDEAFTYFMAEWNPDSAPIRAAMTPTHRSDPMTDKLRDPIEMMEAETRLILAEFFRRGVSKEKWEDAPHLAARKVRAALAAEPQPSTDREALAGGES